MFTCEMSDCDDMISHEVRIETHSETELLEVCDDCATYWKQQNSKNETRISVRMFQGISV
jgi:ribosome-binding protein aMBF1 (putative translation factor)